LNVGTGRGVTVKEVIDAVERRLGRQVPRRIGPRRPGDPAELVADAARIREVWGWTPRYPEIDTMIEHAVAWLAKCPCGKHEDANLTLPAASA
jgi:UDP-glucose 4-epimerase